MLIVIILITIIITSAVVITTIKITQNKNEEVAKMPQQSIAQNKTTTNTLEQNTMQSMNSSNILNQNIVQNETQANNLVQNNVANSQNVIIDLNNAKEYNQYTEMELNGKKVVVKLRKIITEKIDNEDVYDGFDGKEYFVVVDDDENGSVSLSASHYFINIFNENCECIGTIGGGGTGFTVKNTLKPNYEIYENAIYEVRYSKENEPGDFAEHKYTIKDNKLIDEIVESYKINEEEGTTVDGKS